MKNFSILFLVICTILLPLHCNAQVGALVSNTTKQITKILEKKGATELAQYGGKSAIKHSLDKIAAETGEEGLKQTQKYVATWGIRALSAIEVSPKIVMSALNKCPDNLKKRLITLCKKGEPFVKKLGDEGLILESKYAGFGEKIAPLGNDITHIAWAELSISAVKNLSKNAQALNAVKTNHSTAFAKFVKHLKSAPCKTIEILEANPKVLFAGSALIAFTTAKEELVGKEGILVKPIATTGWIVGALFCLFLFFKLNMFFHIREFFKKRKQVNSD